MVVLRRSKQTVISLLIVADGTRALAPGRESRPGAGSAVTHRGGYGATVEEPVGQPRRCQFRTRVELDHAAQLDDLVADQGGFRTLDPSRPSSSGTRDP